MKKITLALTALLSLNAHAAGKTLNCSTTYESTVASLTFTNVYAANPRVHMSVAVEGETTELYITGCESVAGADEYMITCLTDTSEGNGIRIYLASPGAGQLVARFYEERPDMSLEDILNTQKTAECRELE